MDRREQNAFGGTVINSRTDSGNTDDAELATVNIPKGFCGIRHVIAFFAFLGFVNVYALRVNLSVALVAMVNHTSSAADENSTSTQCQNDGSNTTHKSGEFNWDSNTQGLVLGSFFYGYIITQIPGGWLGERIGGKWMFGLGVLGTAILTLLTPVAARTNVYLLVAVRVLEGIGEGVTFPAMHALLSKWAPPLERSKLGTFIYSGAHFGTVVSLPISGLLCDYGFAGGWPSVFYVFGGLGCVWFFVWTFVAQNSPAKHPWISQQERMYIEKSIGHHEKRPAVPWVEIFKSVPFWAIVFAHFGNNWGFYTLLTCLPTYMRTILNFDMSSNGIISAIPYLAIWIVILISGQTADFLRYRHIMSTTLVRKLFCCVGLILPAVFLVSVGYVGCDRTLAVALLTLAVGLNGMSQAGYNVNHLDIGSPFAGTLMGITNMFATIPGFLGPQVVGALTSKNHTVEAWQRVFYISGAVYVAGALLYAFMASGKEQKWAMEKYAMLQNVEESESTDKLLDADSSKSYS